MSPLAGNHKSQIDRGSSGFHSQSAEHFAPPSGETTRVELPSGLAERRRVAYNRGGGVGVALAIAFPVAGNLLARRD